MVAHVFNPNIQEAELGKSLRVPDQPGLHSSFKAARATQ